MPAVQTISTKGQVVIPAKFREALGLQPMGKVAIEMVPGDKKLILSPVGTIIDELCGILSTRGKKARAVKQMIRQEEADYEAKKHGQIRS